MLAKVSAPASVSIQSTDVQIECDLSNGLLGFSMVGLADKAIDESHDKLLSAQSETTNLAVAKRVEAAWIIQQQRLRKSRAKLNANMGPHGIKLHCNLGEAGQILAKQALTRLGLSARGYTRTLKVTRTIADLNESAQIKPQDLAEALQYRNH